MVVQHYFLVCKLENQNIYCLALYEEIWRSLLYIDIYFKTGLKGFYEKNPREGVDIVPRSKIISKGV